MLCAGPTNTGMFRSAKITLEKLQNNIIHEMMFLTKTGRHTEENDGLLCMGGQSAYSPPCSRGKSDITSR